MLAEGLSAALEGLNLGKAGTTIRLGLGCCDRPVKDC